MRKNTPTKVLLPFWIIFSLSRIISSFSSSFSDDPKLKKKDFFSQKKERKTQTKPRKTRSKFWGNLIPLSSYITQLEWTGEYIWVMFIKKDELMFFFIQKETNHLNRKIKRNFKYINGFLDCSPSSEPIMLMKLIVFANPLDFLHKNFLSDPQNVHLPSHLILFDSILPKIESF
ncbi:hypothetical protein M0811_07779 [Anaeramoeba ignava]|uniref:Uncharacterized protein n=1 Tax=Anaeramoeba ignava TaxID=1746090 RepID=A0A9Q0RDT9_ANAIG|nr:hypothetical protein M0811_07779 [Anaeramoeba ignava]